MKTTERIKICLTVVCLALVMAMQPYAQRRVTPVEPTPGTKGTPVKKPEKTPYEDRGRLKEQKDAKGNVIFIDTVTGQEWVDTTLVNEKTKMIFPLVYAVNAGVNLWDPVMRCFGQEYGLGSVWGEFNMHNRYFAALELGVGSAKITPEESNFTFRTPVSPFFKIGLSYNVFYNSDPRYKFLVGVRYGFSPFSYRVTDISLNDGYWGTDEKFEIPKQNATVGYLELLAGVRVNIFGNFSVGWDVRYHSILHESKAQYGEPMYIPGFGKRGAALSGSITVSYTLELNPPTSPVVNNKTDKNQKTTRKK